MSPAKKILPFPRTRTLESDAPPEESGVVLVGARLHGHGAEIAATPSDQVQVVGADAGLTNAAATGPLAMRMGGALAFTFIAIIVLDALR